MKQKNNFISSFTDPANPQDEYLVGVKDNLITIYFDEVQREENSQAEAEDLMQIFLDTEGIDGVVATAYQLVPGFWSAPII